MVSSSATMPRNNCDWGYKIYIYQKYNKNLGLREPIDRVELVQASVSLFNQM